MSATIPLSDKAITTKPDGNDLAAVKRGLDWIFNTQAQHKHIYAKDMNIIKDVFSGLSQNYPALADILDSLLKNNQANTQYGNLRLCYGSTSGKNSGAGVQAGGAVLTVYARDKDFDWVQQRVGSATPFCVVPFRASEVANWVEINQPSSI